jgi:hypothetical protein
MKHAFKLRLLKRSIIQLLGAKKHNVTFQNHPDVYYIQVWLDKPLAEAVDYLSKEACKK